jgi:hypothetical protein
MTNKHPLDLNVTLAELEHASERESETQHGDNSGYISPTLSMVDPQRRPKPRTVCEQCPQSMWFASEMHLKCYCRMMHALTWSSEDPVPILSCDGIILSSE